MKRPTFVMRGSFFILKQVPSRSECASSAARRASASMYIERNLIMLKLRPRSPMRVWRKNTGPRSSSLIASATARKIGHRATSAIAAIAMSVARLMAADAFSSAPRHSSAWRAACAMKTALPAI